MAINKNNRKLIDKVLVGFGVVTTLVLLGASGLALWTYSYIHTTVHDELASQKIFFPPKDSPALAALPASDRTAMNRYAGQQLVTGAQAKTYANHFIGVHLSEVADGKTYAQVSSAALADPTNAKLQGQANTLFKGETLRGLLLGDAYAFSVVAQIAQIVSVVTAVGGGVMLVLVLLGLMHLARSR